MSSTRATSDKDLEHLFQDVQNAWPEELGKDTWYLGVVRPNNSISSLSNLLALHQRIQRRPVQLINLLHFFAIVIMY